MNLLSYQFRLNFGNSCIFSDVSSNCKYGSCCGDVQEIFDEALLEDNEVIKNELDFLCCCNHSEDFLLFLSKKAMFLTA